MEVFRYKIDGAYEVKASSNDILPSLDRVAEEMLCIVEVLVLAHDSDAVAVFQSQVVAGQELDVATDHAADVDTVSLPHVQCAEMLAVERGTCDDAYAALYVGVDSVPVDVFFIPVLIVFLLSKEQRHGLLVLFVGDDEQFVVDVQFCRRYRYKYLLAAPDA